MLSLNTLSALVVGEQAGVAAARAAGFPGKTGESGQGMVTVDPFVPMKQEFWHFDLASQFLVDCLRPVSRLKSEQRASNIDTTPLHI